MQGLAQTRTRFAFAVAAVLLVTAIATPGAQRRRGGDDGGMPSDTGAVLANPEAFFGKTLTISAGVEQMLSKTVFVIDQRKAVGPHEVTAIGTPILVIAPYLNGPIDPKHYIQLRGQMIKFDPAAISKAAGEYALDIAPDVAARYVGQPVLIAASIVDSTYKEIAKKPAAPPSAMELSLTSAMKIIGPGSAALKTAAEAADANAVVQTVATMTLAFTQTETLWDDRGQSYPAQIARDAKDHLAAIQRDATAGNWDGARASVVKLSQTCGSCHGAYRERQEDGTFRIKAGMF